VQGTVNSPPIDFAGDVTSFFFPLLIGNNFWKRTKNPLPPRTPTTRFLFFFPADVFRCVPESLGSGEDCLTFLNASPCRASVG